VSAAKKHVGTSNFFGTLGGTFETTRIGRAGIGGAFVLLEPRRDLIRPADDALCVLSNAIKKKHITH
jgi:hypothetical protein